MGRVGKPSSGCLSKNNLASVENGFQKDPVLQSSTELLD